MTLLRTVVDNFGSAKILCLGDIILDSFTHGHVNRISPERPVPVFLPGYDTNALGGAANVAQNVAALGAKCTIVGLAGTDPPGLKIQELFQEHPNIDARLINSNRITSHKIRFTAAGQHLLRVDTESTESINEEHLQQVLSILEPLIPAHDLLILSDYAKGLLTPALLTKVISLSRQFGKPVIVDPKSIDLSIYANSSLVTPNKAEAERSSGILINNNADAENAGRRIIQQSNISSVLITRGEQGMSLISTDLPPLHLPSDAKKVFDVVGAGDTVIASFCCAVAVGASFVDATRISNLSAGLVVAKPDTSTVTANELIVRLSEMSAGRTHKPDPTVLTLADLTSYVSEQRSLGKTIGFTNGVFDLIHPGHVSLLRFARDNCDCLIIGINSDSSVRRLGKGVDRPIIPQRDRTSIVGAFEMVDATIIFDDDTPLNLIKTIQPDVLIKGGDYTIQDVVGASFVLGYGGSVMLAPMVNGKSSTGIIQRVRASHV
jgi:D-beta-D-heptose 7-phosphate kinase/D-beta-D-heptose 1-phosphate adenosyltransferase